MDIELPITDLYAREILDSRGNPTIEVEVLAGDCISGRAAVPSGASTGKYEALELRDGGIRYGGLGVREAADKVNAKVAPEITGMPVFEWRQIDEVMRKLDGTKDKSNLGANGMLGVSLAVARTGANAARRPLFAYLGDDEACVMPVPMMNILNGGKHADNTVDFQEFMIMPVGACCFKEALRMGTEVYHALKRLLAQDGKSTAVGDEGGFAPDLKDAFEVLEYLTRAVEEAGYECGTDIVFAMDAAASELHEENSGMYYFPGETKVLEEYVENRVEIPDTKKTAVMRSTDEMIALYEKICEQYPVASIEDPLDEEDWDGWKKLTERLGHKVQLVGDDLFVTNTERLKKGIQEGCGNSILIKLNQIGTLSETEAAIRMAQEAGYTAIVSHRSGETEDTTIADLAVAYNCGQIKTGAPCRSERVAKYNRLLRIEEVLGEKAVYQNPMREM
ncbi:MAG: phosphopyruvate hydratase [Faecalimonas sp.]|nr:phosphopyruvate hydratase [Faecalimonas sp.]